MVVADLPELGRRVALFSPDNRASGRLFCDRLFTQHRWGTEIIMKVLTLLGSPRNNGNTATALGWMEDALKAKNLSDRVQVKDVSEMLKK